MAKEKEKPAQSEMSKEAVKAGLNPQAMEWVRYNITSEFSSQYSQLIRDSEKYAKTMNNEFKTSKERSGAAENYRDTLLKAIENMDGAIAQLKGRRGNFMLFFGDQEKEFDNYVANFEQSRAGTVKMLWEHTEKALGNGDITKITIPIPEGTSVKGLEKKYPNYRFEPIVSNMESDEASVIITLRPSLQIANFEGDKMQKAKPGRKIDTQFE